MGIGIATATSRRPQNSTPDINITPLVDVVLVLLIIFMVIAPALEHGERVELPGVSTPDTKNKTSVDPITVTIASSGSFYLEKESVDEATLQTKLLDIRAHEPDRKVVLKGDSALPYERVRSTFARIQSMGFPGVALMVQKKKGTPGETEAAEEGE